MRRQAHRRRLQHHEGVSLSRDNQINNYSREWRQDYQVMAMAAIQVGSFTSMVTRLKWSKKSRRGN
jgi:hypothetical protein